MSPRIGVNPFDNNSDDDFDNDFDDDLFDNLPNSTIRALESNEPVPKQLIKPDAIRSHNEEPTRPSLTTLNPSSGQQYRNATDRSLVVAAANIAPATPSANNASIAQEEVIDLDSYSAANQHGFQNGASNSYQSSITAAPQAAMSKRQETHTGSLSVAHRPIGHVSQSSQSHAQSVPNLDLSALQARIQQLNEEKEQLKQAAASAELQLQAKMGEAAILRQKIDKTCHEYEQRLEIINQSHVDLTAKHRAEIEALQAERDKIEINNRFLEHDINLESNRTRHVQKVVPVIAPTRILPDKPRQNTASPRKQQHYSLGDGFDDSLVPPLSPSRTQSGHDRSGSAVLDDRTIQYPASPARSYNGSKQGTPSKRTDKKRKRHEETCITQCTLDLFPDPSTKIHPSPSSPNSPRLHHYSATISPSGRQAAFLNSLLAYTRPATKMSFFSVMSRFSLPSNPDALLSRIIMDRWAINTKPIDKILPEFCNVICQLWNECIDQSFLHPCDALSDVLYFVTSNNGSALSRQILTSVLPPAMKSVNAVAFPIASANSKTDDNIPFGLLDSTLPLQLLLTIARDCQEDKQAISSFWSTVDLHWTLVLLYPTQPHYHITLICSLLRTSVLDHSFGPIYKDSRDFSSVNDQDDVEQILIDRFSSLLLSTPKSLKSNEKVEQEQVLSFRLAILDTLNHLTTMPHSSQAIAKHPTAIGRLIQFLHQTVDMLYQPCTMVTAIHDLVASCIKISIHTLFHLLTEHSDQIDIREKLKTIDGGLHSHLIVLTRIAFCESILLERGVEPAVSDAAHMLLDDFLSPIEGEQLLKMFPAPELAATLPIPSKFPDRPTAEQPKGIEKERIIISAATNAPHNDAMDLS